ncbi:winged helix-turn-helix transcriptional regulator [Methanosarcina sp. UBA289]|uniref:winged helix-turn-helix transcriptional regulator n=1 Tax=Methanosarcina sp. UBA289 TaxID=1915574 RepID=UPI0025CC9AA1|nr:winged helix-turn-helix transcriptional regulator [Methanosarcina sp. UBA289]
MELDLETRRKIYEQINKSPGVHFRELERRLKLVVGSLQYHLHYLEKKKLIVASNDDDYLRYFVIDKNLNEKEIKILSLLRRSSCRHILIQLLNNPDLNNKDLSLAVGLSPSTISWNLNKLVEAGVIERKKTGRISNFTIIDPTAVVELLICYKESFLDTLVDSFIETWEFKNFK